MPGLTLNHHQRGSLKVAGSMVSTSLLEVMAKLGSINQIETLPGTSRHRIDSFRPKFTILTICFAYI